MTAIEQNVKPLIAELVAEATKKFAGDVVRIRYYFGEDWEGDPAIFFQALLTDDAASEQRLGDVADRVRKALCEPLYTVQSAPFPFVRFRSQSEQDKLKDPLWD